ncbi:MAG: dCTP deaminase [Acidimicrobiales bacterium]
MILSNTEIAKAIQEGRFSISPLSVASPGEAPFNTSAIDLHLASQLRVPRADQPVAVDLTSGGIAPFLAANSESKTISDDQPYRLDRNHFVLANTVERVDFPLSGDFCYAARVEGRSSLARCGILVHFTAPTIHAGFEGTITLEIINLGFAPFLLRPNLSICQLIIEEVRGIPTIAPNQFRGQSTPEGV